MKRLLVILSLLVLLAGCCEQRRYYVRPEDRAAADRLWRETYDKTITSGSASTYATNAADRAVDSIYGVPESELHKGDPVK